MCICSDTGRLFTRYAITVLLHHIAYSIGNAISFHNSCRTPKPDQTLVDEAFSCYDRKVLVRQRQALGERD